MEIRKTFRASSPESVKVAFRAVFKYDPETGQIKNNKTGRLYSGTTPKGYSASIYLVVNDIEYRVTFHRLCWFLYYNEVVPDNIEIDHRDTVKANNRIDNLRLANDLQNARNKGIRKDNTTGYKGVMVVKNTTKYYTYGYFTAVINLGIPAKLAIFKTAIEAAIFYDSAARFYFKEFANCNFEKQYLPPMSISELRKYKRTKQPIPAIND